MADILTEDDARTSDMSSATGTYESSPNEVNVELPKDFFGVVVGGVDADDAVRARACIAASTLPRADRRGSRRRAYGPGAGLANDYEDEALQLMLEVEGDVPAGRATSLPKSWSWVASWPRWPTPAPGDWVLAT